MRNFHGVIAPVTTPFTADGGLEAGAFARNLRRYVDSGLTGVLVGGTTGEGVHLSPVERKQLLELAAAEIGPRTLMAGLPGQSVTQSVRELRSWEQLPISAVLAGVPNYYRPRMTEAAIAAYYAALADASPFPVLLYNIPKLSGIELSAGLILRLSAHPRIAGIKESAANLGLIQQLQDRTDPARFSVISGSGETFGSALDLGVNCGILAAACMVPELAVAVHRSVGSPVSSAPLRRWLFRFASVVVSGLGIAGIKAAMDALGFEGLNTRLPLLPLSGEERQRLRDLLTEAAADPANSGWFRTSRSCLPG